MRITIELDPVTGAFSTATVPEQGQTQAPTASAADVPLDAGICAGLDTSVATSPVRTEPVVLAGVSNGSPTVFSMEQISAGPPAI